jgi:saccharopine dehydrogenase-like NADP-dependent oxidoreductase
MHVAVVGLGTTGSQVARQLRPPEVARITLYDVDEQRIGPVRGSLDDNLEIIAGLPSTASPPDVTILAGPVGTHYDLARSLLTAGGHVVSISDDPNEVQRLLRLDPLAVSQHRSLVVGAGFCPGLTEILARWAGDQLDQVDGVSVATAGTGGPACARQHHRAFKRDAHDWRDGVWEYRRGGSGRDLAWFPDPIGARDTYFAALASPLLLQRTYPTARRISARVSATRRDRLTERLPMLRPPHRDGGPGGIRVEVRGRLDGAVETLVYGVMDYPSVAAGTVSAVVAIAAAREQAPLGASGLCGWDDPATLLVELHNRGVQVASFSGQVVPKH